MFTNNEFSVDLYFFSYVNFIGYYLFVVMCLYEKVLQQVRIHKGFNFYF